jgi:hypothetical protein
MIESRAIDQAGDMYRSHNSISASANLPCGSGAKSSAACISEIALSGRSSLGSNCNVLAENARACATQSWKSSLSCEGSRHARRSSTNRRALEKNWFTHGCKSELRAKSPQGPSRDESGGRRHHTICHEELRDGWSVGSTWGRPSTMSTMLVAFGPGSMPHLVVGRPVWKTRADHITTADP